MGNRIVSAARVPPRVRFLSAILQFLLAAGVPLGFNRLITIPGRISGPPRTTAPAVIELDLTQRVGFFRDVLGPLARGIPFGIWFIRIVDGVDLAHPLEAAEGRRIFEVHQLREVRGASHEVPS